MTKGWHKESGKHREAYYEGRKRCLHKNITNNTFLFGDADKDSVKNIDDSHPLDPKKNESPEMKLSEELGRIDEERTKYKGVVKGVEGRLKRQGFKTQSRVKGRNSIVNKLRRNYFRELKDIGGVMVLTKDKAESYNVGRFIEGNFFVVEKKDYYIAPKDGYYRALHYVVRMGEGQLVEVQVKTEKEYELHQKGHYSYKMANVTAKQHAEFIREFQELMRKENEV